MPFALATEGPDLPGHGRCWRREARSAWLRLAVLLILVANLSAGEEHANLLVHLNVVAAYALATAAAIALALLRRGPSWAGAAFIVLDALLVLALFHEHLFARSPGFDHELTASGIAVSFLLLAHVALRLKARLVALFAGLVLAGWLPLIALAALWGAGPAHHAVSLGAEAALASAFTFAAFTLFLLVSDHAAVVRSAVASERRRTSLSRFFSPAVVAELEAEGATPALHRRDAAVMFVDLRSFSRFSEGVEPMEVASMLSEYRDLVAGAVFAHGGTVDKFIGDGVMAVFGHPRAAPDDAARALRCAEEVAASLARWGKARGRAGRQALDAGVGVHYGSVVAGVLASGGHHEFSIFGDAVNVAERMEGATKLLDASVVVSHALLDRVPRRPEDKAWVLRGGLDLDGRSGPVYVAYLPRRHRLDPSGRSPALHASAEPRRFQRENSEAGAPSLVALLPGAAGSSDTPQTATGPSVLDTAHCRASRTGEPE